MKGSDLSARTKELGYEIPRSTLANIEIGRKSAIGLHEIIILAAALEVSPTSLLFDVGNESLIELLPGDHRAQIEASSWFAGLQPLLPPFGLRQYGSFSTEGLDDVPEPYRGLLEDKEYQKTRGARRFEDAMSRYFEVTRRLRILRQALEEVEQGLTPAFSMLHPEFETAGVEEYRGMIAAVEQQAREYWRFVAAFHNDALMVGAKMPFLDTEIREDVFKYLGGHGDEVLSDEGDSNGQTEA